MKKTVAMCIIVAGLFSAGCTKVINPVTGKAKYTLTPATVAVLDTVEKAADNKETIGGAVAAVNPVAGAILATGLGVFGALYKKWKKPLMQERTRNELIVNGGELLVDALKELKANKPDLWASNVKPLIVKAKSKAGVDFVSLDTKKLTIVDKPIV